MSDPGDRGSLPRYYGKYRGRVINNVDLDFRGRLLFSATVGGTPIQTWAEACTPFAGPASGFYAIPQIGAGVWIEFEEGDLNRPIWTGCWWKTGDLEILMTPDTPPLNKATAPNTVVLRHGAGRIKLDTSGVTIDPLVPGVSVKVGAASIEITLGPNKVQVTTAAVMINNQNLVILP